MAEPVVKKRETEEEFKTLIQSANSGQCAKMAEAVAKEQETKLVKPVSNSTKPNQMAEAVVKERETNEVKSPHETVKPHQMAEAVTNQRLKPVHPRYIAINVRSQDGKVIFFQIKRDSNLKKLLISYCQRCSVDYPSARFLIDGQLFNHNKTAEQLKLEDETEIDVMVQNFGGGEQSFASISAD